MKKIIAILAAVFIITVIGVNVTADENYEDHSYEGDSPNANGDIQHPDDTGGDQEREEPRTRNKDN
jgi:preprotein translocase subunit SecG